MFPRYQGDNFRKNLDLVAKLEEIAVRKEVSPAQLAIAWVLAQNVVTIPGTKRPKYVEQNVAAADIRLSAEDLAELDRILPVGSVSGVAYPTFS